MAAAIHIEIDVLFLLLLLVIARQINDNVNKQTIRLLFRNVTFGIIAALFLDTLWMLIDGRVFPGGIFLNKAVNGIFLGLGVVLGGLWYLYVLTAMGYNLSRLATNLVMLPGYIFMFLNILSIWTGWIFTVNDQNVYIRGAWFPLQEAIALLMLFISLIHLIVMYFSPRGKPYRPVILKLVKFYIIPVTGTVLSMPYSGMPGTWVCAAVSVVLIYMDDQEAAIVRDSLTGLNNRKTLHTSFNSYSHQTSEAKNLYLFIFDLDKFKSINDTLGHTVGDQALVEAARLLTRSMGNLQGIVARYGGDEFIVMGFFPGEPDAVSYENQVKGSFEEWNRTHDAPYTLSISAGFSCYHEGQTLEELISAADKDLYLEKRGQ